MRSVILAFLSISIYGQDIKALFPTSGPKPIGPYSPGISLGDFVFVSGQGVGDGSGKRPADTRGQAIQCINNVRNILRLGQMDLANIFSLQVYLTDKSQEAIVDQDPVARLRRKPSDGTSTIEDDDGKKTKTDEDERPTLKRRPSDKEPN